VLILLPPSEGKTSPSRGKRLDLADLDFPDLTEPRAIVLAAVLDLCSTSATRSGTLTPLHDEVRLAYASTVLGLGPSQQDHIHRNAQLLRAPTARADRIYSGVLYDALDIESLDAVARRRATRWLVIMSALFGAVRPNDQIPAYRLSGDNAIPGLGTMSTYWRDHLDPVLTDAAGSGLVVDLRSTSYASFWRPPTALTPRVAQVRVLQQVGDERKVVSHFNKATKGRIVRDLLEDGGAPDTPEDLALHLKSLGWAVELQPPRRAGQRLDVIVEEV
jgi:cytoplasmic iron level regulating protein YaaA (DUF328/UPF0246 family)